MKQEIKGLHSKSFPLIRVTNNRAPIPEALKWAFRPPEDANSFGCILFTPHPQTQKSHFAPSRGLTPPTDDPNLSRCGSRR